MEYNIANMTAQEVFDAACNHLLTQNQQSMITLVNDSGIEYSDCAYRGENGLKCAAGIFISDEVYNTLIEQQKWDILCRDGIVPSAHFDLIKSLQLIHDGYAPYSWKRELMLLAGRYHLTVPQIVRQRQADAPIV